MDIQQDVLEAAAKEGAMKVAEALSRFSGEKVQAEISQAETVNIKECYEKISKAEAGSIVSCARIDEGPSGVAFLVSSREDTLTLVDILNDRPIGSTGILKDIDRSAVNEMLNILSNTYLTALSEETGITLSEGVPNLITVARMEDILKRAVDTQEMTILFGTTLTISSHQISTSLYLIFSKELAELL